MIRLQLIELTNVVLVRPYSTPGTWRVEEQEDHLRPGDHGQATVIVTRVEGEL
jgi:hypothetical protein